MKPNYPQTSNYLRSWGLQVAPFLHRDLNRFFCGSAQRNALIQIEQFISSGEQFATLMGETGCGMTRILEHLTQLAGLGDCAVEISMTSEMPTADERVRAVWLQDREQTHQWRSPREFPSDVSVLRGTDLNGTKTHGQKALTKPFGQCSRLIELARMSLDDAISYVPFSIRMAGGRRTIFTESAVVRMHEYSRGRIRDFSFLAENALWECSADQETMISARVIERIALPKRWAA